MMNFDSATLRLRDSRESLIRDMLKEDDIRKTLEVERLLTIAESQIRHVLDHPIICKTTIRVPKNLSTDFTNKLTEANYSYEYRDCYPENEDACDIIIKLNNKE